MRRLLMTVVFGVFVLASTVALAQTESTVAATEEVASENEVTVPAEEVVEAEAPVAENATVAEDAPPVPFREERLTGRQMLENGLTVRKGATAMINVNENEVNVPDEINVHIKDRSWCVREPGWCAVVITTSFAVATVTGFVIADQCGAFDHTNSVMYR